MPSSEIFAPYAISSQLGLSVEQFSDAHTGEQLRFPGSSIGEGAVDLAYEIGADGWSELAVSMVAELPVSELESVLHRNEEAAESTELIVTVSCSSAMIRRAVVLDELHPGRWEATATLRRDSFRGVITLRPRLVRTRTAHGEHQSPAKAIERGAIVAEGPEIRLRLDERASPFAGGLEVRWADFRASEHPWRLAHDSDIYSLEIEGDEPVLWLNERYAELQAALHDPNPKGTTELLKTMSLALIGQGVMTMLFQVAAASLGPDAETGEAVMPGGWRGEVLRELLPHLYPNQTEVQRTNTLVSDLTSDGAMAGLITRLGSAVHEKLGLAKTIERAIRAGREG